MLALTFQIGPNRLALDIRQVREVVPRVHLDQPAGKARWLAGLVVYRGQAVPVIDLHYLLGAGECPRHLSSRIILVPLTSITRTGFVVPPSGGAGAGVPPLGGDAQRPPEGGTTSQEQLIGLLAAQVADICEVEFATEPLPAMNEMGQPDLGIPVVENGGILHLLDMPRLLPEPIQRMVLALPGPEVPP